MPSFRLGLAIIRAAMDIAPQQFAWKEPGYEYDYSNLPIDLILGHLQAHTQIEQGLSWDDTFWSEGLQNYQARAENLLIYPRKLNPGLCS
ncbi:MAG: hypothetical protein NTX25_02645 [Proteobacteria bacterium]|nr:hypothetical protein [Pseudomonadota bacterium]